MVGIFTDLSAWEVGLLAALAASLGYLFWALMPRLTSPDTRCGIISLELAYNRARAAKLLNSWNQQGRLGAVRRSVYVDFAFLASYSTLAALLAVLLSRLADTAGVLSPDHADTLGTFWPLAMWAAGALDAAENVALLRLIPTPRTPPVLAASIAATTKFALLLAGLVIAIVTVIASVVGWVT